MSPPPKDPDSEGRKSERKRVLLGGRLIFEQLGATAECRIKDLTREGARLVFTNEVMTPDTFEMIEQRNGVLYSCEVAWRKSREMGVIFHRQTELALATEGHEARMKRLWLDSLIR